MVQIPTIAHRVRAKSVSQKEQELQSGTAEKQRVSNFKAGTVEEARHYAYYG